MELPAEIGVATGPASERELLCDLLLKVAGRDTNRLPSVIRHVAALEAAIPYMTTAQASIARDRIHRHADRFGSSLRNAPDPLENGEIAPIEVVTRWLSVRRYSERHLSVFHPVAIALLNGQRSLTRLIEVGYRHEIDGLLIPPSLDTFREWLLQLRIAKRELDQTYAPGLLCQWWAKEMDPGNGSGTAYADCLKRLGIRMRFRRSAITA